MHRHTYLRHKHSKWQNVKQYFNKILQKIPEWEIIYFLNQDGLSIFDSHF